MPFYAILNENGPPTNCQPINNPDLIQCSLTNIVSLRTSFEVKIKCGGLMSR